MFDLPRRSPTDRGWKTRSLRAMLQRRSERNRPDLPLLSVARERGVFVRSSTDDNHNSIPDDLSNYKVARKGDLVVNKMKAWQGSLGLAPVDGIVSPAYFVFQAAFAVPQFGEYLLRSRPYVAKFAAASDGVRVGQWDLSIPHMRSIEVQLPAKAEQIAIVKYLVHASARIDSAIAAKLRMLELLSELHQAQRNSVLSSIPVGASQTQTSLSQSANLIQTGPFGSQLHASEYVHGGIPVINPSHLTSGGIEPELEVTVTREKALELRRHSLAVGDVIAARRGDLGRCSIVSPGEAGWLCGTGSLIIRLRQDLWLPEFFQIAFSAPSTREQLTLRSVGSTMANLNAEQVSSLRVPRPSLEAQRIAVEEISRLELAHERRITAIKAEVVLLQEFRTRLVADVVTGQVDVREVAAKLPDAPEAAVDLAPDFDEELTQGVERAASSEPDFFPTANGVTI